MRSDILVTALERGLLPPAEFTHERHVQAAWYYLRRQPMTAERQFAATLLRYVHHLGAISKYHATMTSALVRLIHARMPETGADPALELVEWREFKAANPDLFGHWKALLARHYSADRLASGREHFVEPDREPLP